METGVLIGDQGLDVALEDAAPEVARAGRVVDLVLAVLAHVDEVKALAGIQAGLDVRGCALADVPLGLGHQGEKSRAVLHDPSYAPAGASTAGAPVSGLPASGAPASLAPVSGVVVVPASSSSGSSVPHEPGGTHPPILL
jgi:hypothetical protein